MGSTLEPGQVVAGRYRVEKQIGEGGMGSVYLVQHVHTDERLAMKVLHAQVLRDESAVERFRREARAPARIASEHVARVTDADTAPDLDGAPFIVMEYLQGRDLEDISREMGRMPPADVVEYMRQVARALDKAHGMGIVHRDLKPENLFLTRREDGTPCVKLLDFGIARIAEAGQSAKSKTQSGAVFGTPAFMSPEQTMGDVDSIGPPTDIWALGLIVYRLLMGHDYWTAPTIAQLYVELLTSRIAPPSERGSPHGAAFDTWFLACVVRDPNQRFRSAGDAVYALATALGLEGRVALPSFAEAHSTPGAPISVETPRFVSGPPAAVSDSPMATTDTSVATKRTSLLTFVLAGSAIAAAGLVFVLWITREPTVVGAQTNSPETTAGKSVPDSPRPTATAGPAVTPSGAAAQPSANQAEAPLAAPNRDSPPAREEPAGRPGRTFEPAPRATAKPSKTEEPAPAAPARETNEVSGDQRRRLDVLKRLCDSGTYTPAECASKRSAILHGSN